MLEFLIWIVSAFFQLATIVVIVDIFLAYFMSPYHPVRETLDRIVNPVLAPIRRVVPPVGMIDFSPMVLLIILQLLRYLVVNTIIAIAL